MQSIYLEAIDSYEKLINIDPKHSEAWYWKGINDIILLGYSLFTISKFQEAYKCFEYAIKIDPKNTYAINQLKLTKDALKKQ